MGTGRGTETKTETESARACMSCKSIWRRRRRHARVVCVCGSIYRRRGTKSKMVQQATGILFTRPETWGEVVGGVRIHTHSEEQARRGYAVWLSGLLAAGPYTHAAEGGRDVGWYVM